MLGFLQTLTGLPKWCYFLAGIVVCILVFILCYIWRQHFYRFIKKRYHFWILIVLLRKHRRLSAGIVVSIIVFFFISAGVVFWALPKSTVSGQAQPSFWLLIARSPGTFLAVIMALITGLGFMITITRIHEIMGRITRYDEFLIRATNLLRYEIKHSQHGVRTVWFVCTTPLHGNLTERNSGHFSRYRKALSKAREELVLRILHLPMAEMRIFYSRFSEEGRYSQEEVEGAIGETEAFLQEINQTSKLRDEERTIGHQNVLPSHITQHLWSEIGYRLIISENRAIFYVPLFLPIESGFANENQQAQQPLSGKARVEMMGFETEDPFVVNQLIANCDYLSKWSLCKSG